MSAFRVAQHRGLINGDSLTGGHRIRMAEGMGLGNRALARLKGICRYEGPACIHGAKKTHRGSNAAGFVVLVWGSHALLLSCQVL